MTLPHGGTPDDVRSTEEIEAVAAAREEQAELRRDGPAPSAAAVLREMGRDENGAPLEDGPVDVSPHEAARRALGLSDGDRR